MGPCTQEIISGRRRKWEQSTSIRSSKSRQDQLVPQFHKSRSKFGKSSTPQRLPSLFVITNKPTLLLLLLLVIFPLRWPVAVQASSLDTEDTKSVPLNEISSRIRNSSFIQPATPLLPSSTNTSDSRDIKTSTTTLSVEPLTEVASGDTVAGTSENYVSSSTPSQRIIRSTSTASESFSGHGSAVTESTGHGSTTEYHRTHKNGGHHERERIHGRPQEQRGARKRTLQEICGEWEERGCKCGGTADDVSLNCHAVSVDDVPSDLPDNLIKLDLSATNISILQNNAFAHLHKLEELSLAENQLLNIERNSFKGLSKLKRLVLSNCRLNRVPGESFKHLSSLDTLRLDRNEIEHLDEDSFENVPKLRTLGLNRNLINMLSRHMMSKFASSLEYLNLANNRITLIDENDFPRMDQLSVISLKRNRISKINDGAFRNLPKLKSLDLDDNFLTGIPNEFRTLGTLQELSVSNNKIHWILDGDLPRSLTSFEVRANPIKNIQSRAFRNFTVLKKIVLSDAKNLVELPTFDGSPSIEILRVDRASLTHIPESLCETSPRLKSLELKSNKLERVPKLFNCHGLRVLDLSGNKIRSLDGQPFRDLGQLHDLVLSHNELVQLQSDTFTGLGALQSLDMEGNNIQAINQDTFSVFQRLEDLNLGNNIFPRLPTNGLQKLLHLKTFNNPKLREFPPPNTFPRIQTLVLSYAYHCCAFQPVVAQNNHPFVTDEVQESVIFPSDSDFDMSLWDNNVTDIWPQLDNLSKKFGPQINELWDNFGSDFTYPGNLPSYVEEYFDEEAKGFRVNSGHSEFGSFGGEAEVNGQYLGSVQCLPLPGPFLPCTDLFDWWTLRCGVWVVFLLAMLGNGTVVFVLVFSRSKMDVPRFLVCNLAAADFFMGVYLGILAVVDASTLGEFRMFAIPWQMSGGCQLAGFLAVLSSELSVYTLAVITLERNYAITHAMHLNKRLSLRHAGYIMAVGWAFALTMAILPLFGVSDYRKFAVCLPFETTTGPGSLAYVIFLMVINGVAFLILMGCYLKMYCAIRGSQAWNSNDSRIAKRMALLVFTDFLCWSPIAFLSLTAAFGLHLISLEQAKVFTVFILPLNSCCNPFLYAILTKQFKKDCVMICKAIEESRVTRGIGRCRHSSNFSNRHTPANTNSLVERSSKDGPVIVPGAATACGCTKSLLERPLDKYNKFNGGHNHHFHHSSFDGGHPNYHHNNMQNAHNHHHHHHNHNYNNHKHYGDEDVEQHPHHLHHLHHHHSEYRYHHERELNAFQRFWRRFFLRQKRTDGHRGGRGHGEYAYQIAEIQHKQQHKRAGSMSSSENFSSRSDSWRNGPPHHNCGVPLRLLDPRRRHSSWLIRKTSQDSNLSSSRNDSSATTVTNASTSTFRLSRSSGTSTPLPPLIVSSRNSIPGCGGKPRLIRQPAMHEELAIDMSPCSSSSPRLGVRFLPTIPSAADSSIILDGDTDSGCNDNAAATAELMSRQDSNDSEGLIIMVNHCQRRVTEEDEEENEDGVSLEENDPLRGEKKHKTEEEAVFQDEGEISQSRRDIVVNLAEEEVFDEDEDEEREEQEMGNEDDDDGLEMRLGSTEAPSSASSGMNEKRRSSDSSRNSGTFQSFYTVLGTGGNTRATLTGPSPLIDGDRRPP